ncbi:twin-arginine translocase TatA/TatE family subunit [candidate division TA06 bacterium]|jgi:sec-independent protein translocase protein TatA|uniref:Sec-independent protein translocase protein TatA n=1 Tax=candidate division TA06 bacterium TaxID=2250710 RepID=A0A523UY21_UNCT6|nr:MAG: twin-arginine translocase TatA/TatE family subunit [candidate division TA06 bacterium]
MFGTIGWQEILLVFLVVLLLFGAKRLPEVGKSFGKGLKEFRNAIKDVTRELEKDDEPEKKV